MALPTPLPMHLDIILEQIGDNFQLHFYRIVATVYFDSKGCASPFNKEIFLRKFRNLLAG